VSAGDDALALSGPYGASLQPGQRADFRVWFRNSGTTIWWSSLNYLMAEVSTGTVYPLGACSPRFPEQSCYWDFTYTAGSQPGVDTYGYRMWHNGYFGDTLIAAFEVVLPTPPPTRVPTATPVRVQVRVTPQPAVGLASTITARTGGCTPDGQLQGLRFTRLTNATAEIATVPPQVVSAPGTVLLPARPASVALMVRRVQGGAPSTVEFVVLDGCGEWPTLIGGGVGAF
jgi:hypothetical protein